MRKVLIGVVMFLASVLGFIGLASCADEEQQPPAHEHSLKYRNNEVFHRQICTVCFEKFIWRPHQWGDWVETKAATQDEKGSHYRVCSVCNYKETKVIDRLPIAAGETTAEWTAVYVQVPAGWDNVNIFYFNSTDSENLSYDYMMSRPGKAMTLVDETKHIYGFQLPKGVDRIEFFSSEGNLLVGDLKWSPERNMLVIQETVQWPPIVTYKNYTPKDTDPELAKPTKNPPITYVTMYVKLPEAWDACNIFFSGVQFAESDAQGVPMTKVKGQENVWMYDKVVEGSTRIGVNNNKFGDSISNITARIEDVPKEANAFIIIKNGDHDYNAVPAIYENGVFTKIGIQELWIRGTMNEWDTTDTYKMTIEDNEATIELDLESGDEFKISDEKWSDWATFGYVDTLGSAFSKNNNGNIYVLDTGTYIITISNLDDINPILSITAKS